jgi:hypothetical protein
MGALPILIHVFSFRENEYVGEYLGSFNIIQIFAEMLKISKNNFCKEQNFMKKKQINQ